jgi:hypothetical protein
MSEKWARAVGLYEVIAGSMFMLNLIVIGFIDSPTITSVPVFAAAFAVQAFSIVGGFLLISRVRGGVPISFFVQLLQCVGIRVHAIEIALWSVLSFTFTFGWGPGLVSEGQPFSFAVSINLLALVMTIFLLWYWDHAPKR